MILTLEEIIVGDRVRRDLGDLTSLCESMTEVGLINPITVDGQEDGSYRLIAGARRLEAARRLGWLEIDAHVVECLADAVLALKAERDENTCREPFSVLDALKLGKRLEALLERDADRRKEEGRRVGGQVRQGSSVENCHQADRAKVRDQVGASIGMSGRTYAKAREVAAAAEDESLPVEVRQTAAAAAEQMDRTHKVDAAHRLVVQAKKQADSDWPADQAALRELLESGETVVVNIDTMHHVVGWARQRGLLVLVDRSSPWGNPFVLNEDGDRTAVIRKYGAHYLPHKNKLTASLKSLRGKALGCHCAPLPCHGDVLKEASDAA